MQSSGDGRWRRRKGMTCSAAFIALFTLLTLIPDPVYSQSDSGSVVGYSIVTLESQADLPILARYYHTTVEQILADNPHALPIKKGTVLTIRENTLSSKETLSPNRPGLSRGGNGGEWYWPVRGGISSYYGLRTDGFHHGLDIATDSGVKVRAAGVGIVLKAGWEDVYGFTVVLDHGGGVQTLYAHNSKILVKPGDEIGAGKVIALSGATGKSTGPHVHFEFRLNGKALNPLEYLPPTQIVASEY